MTSRFILESFDIGTGPVDPQTQQALASSDTHQNLENDASAAYEKGFRAGWDDCVNAGTLDQSRIAEAFGRRLGEAALSATDARRAILNEIMPLFSEILEKILPVLVQKSFLPRMLDEILTVCAADGPEVLHVCVCPEDAVALEQLIMASHGIPPCKIIADPTLGLSQATLKVGDAERRFDLSGLLDTIEVAFDEFSEAQKEAVNG